MNPKIILTFALSLCACGPGLAIGYGDTGPWDDDAGDADSGGSETGVPVDMGGDVDPCEPGTVDCECYQGDLDADGVATPGGECFLGGECDGITCVPNTRSRR